MYFKKSDKREQQQKLITNSKDPSPKSGMSRDLIPKKHSYTDEELSEQPGSNTQRMSEIQAVSVDGLIDTERIVKDKKVIISRKFICRYIPRFYLDSIPLAFNRLNPYLLNFVSQIFIAWYKSAIETAAFGLGTALYTFFWSCVTQVNGETMGIQCTQAKGANNWPYLRNTFYRALIWNYLIDILSFTLYANMYYILVAMNFEEELASKTYYMVVCMIPSQIIQTYNEMARNQLISVQIYKPFTIINLISFALFFPGGYLFIWLSETNY